MHVGCIIRPHANISIFYFADQMISLSKSSRVYVKNVKNLNRVKNLHKISREHVAVYEYHKAKKSAPRCKMHALYDSTHATISIFEILTDR